MCPACMQDLSKERANSFNVLGLFITTSLMSIRVNSEDQLFITMYTERRNNLRTNCFFFFKIKQLFSFPGKLSIWLIRLYCSKQCLSKAALFCFSQFKL